MTGGFDNSGKVCGICSGVRASGVREVDIEFLGFELRLRGQPVSPTVNRRRWGRVGGGSGVHLANPAAQRSRDKWVESVRTLNNFTLELIPQTLNSTCAHPSLLRLRQPVTVVVAGQRLMQHLRRHPRPAKDAQRLALKTLSLVVSTSSV